MTETRTLAHYQAEAIKALQAEVFTLKTKLAEATNPERGMVTLSAGGYDFSVRYEFAPGCKPIYDADSPLVGPGSDPEITDMDVYINGEWMDAFVLFTRDITRRWESDCIEHALETA